MMKILVTGGTGMVGKNLINQLEDKNYSLIKPKKKDLNLLESKSVNEFIKKNNPDSVIHCAGLVGGIQANIKNPYSFLFINTQIGFNLVSACVNNNIKKFINLGSSCMYPKESNGFLTEEMILTGLLEPTNEGYAISKIATAKLCEFAGKQHNLNYKTIIPCNLYGKYDKFDPSNSHLIPAAIRKLHLAKLGKGKPIIWGDGTARREFMYVEDLTDFIEWSLRNYELLDNLTNIGLGYDYSILDYYKEISNIVGYNGEFIFDKSKPQGMRNKLCSVEKQNKLGWSPKHDLKEGLKKTYKFYLDNYEI